MLVIIPNVLSFELELHQGGSGWSDDEKAQVLEWMSSGWNEELKREIVAKINSEIHIESLNAPQENELRLASFALGQVLGLKLSVAALPSMKDKLGLVSSPTVSDVPIRRDGDDAVKVVKPSEEGPLTWGARVRRAQNVHNQGAHRALEYDIVFSWCNVVTSEDPEEVQTTGDGESRMSRERAAEALRGYGSFSTRPITFDETMAIQSIIVFADAASDLGLSREQLTFFDTMAGAMVLRSSEQNAILPNPDGSSAFIPGTLIDLRRRASYERNETGSVEATTRASLVLIGREILASFEALC